MTSLSFRRFAEAKPDVLIPWWGLVANQHSALTILIRVVAITPVFAQEWQ
ncbi:hypothetical protein [Izhakiella capsodis]